MLLYFPNDVGFGLIRLCFIIMLVADSAHHKVCQLHQQALMRTDILHIPEYAKFGVQNVFHLIHFVGTQGIFYIQIYIIVVKAVQVVVQEVVIHLVVEIIIGAPEGFIVDSAFPHLRF